MPGPLAFSSAFSPSSEINGSIKPSGLLDSSVGLGRLIAATLAMMVIMVFTAQSFADICPTPPPVVAARQ